MQPYRRLHRGFTREAVADIRHRYVETDEPQQSIADDYGVHRKTIEQLARREGWPMRGSRGPRDRPDDVVLLAEAERAVDEQAGAGLAADRPQPDDSDAPPESSPPVADRLERAVERELAVIERKRATLGMEPQPPPDAERTARILQRLTDTLWKVRRLRAPDMPETVPDDFDDIPKDIDEFRRALARRIEAFVRNRYGGAVPAAGKAVGDDPPEE
jgi:hypothetical protein